MERWRTQDELASPNEHTHRFIARQPIFDRQRNTFGYELLFRAGWANYFTGEPETASQSVIDDTLSFGMKSLVGDGAAFINCTYKSLMEGAATLLPSDAVLEILETVVVDDALVAVCKKLAASGYRIALDDFDFDSRWDRLLPYATFIKVDFLASTAEQRKALIAKVKHYPVQLLAEKVEDDAAFQIALLEGFHLFQGYFFARPVVVARPALTAIMQRMRLFAKLRKPEFNTARLLALLKEEPSISLRVLRLANTAVMGPRGTIRDLRTALVCIGQERFRKLALGALASEVVGPQTAELHQRILQRGRFCEGVAPYLGVKPEEAFFFGILSVIKPILELNQDEICRMITLGAEMMSALAGEDNRFQRLLRAVEHFETGQWELFTQDASHLGLVEHDLARLFRQAQHWADGVLQPNALAA